VREIIRYLGRDCLDAVLYSSTRFAESALEAYARQNQVPVVARDAGGFSQVSGARFMAGDISCGVEFVRHDSLKLAQQLKSIFEKR
jgi:hypothetical protein